MARPKNGRLPGIENGKIIKEVSNAAEAYEEARDERMKMLEKEIEAKDHLAEVMKKHKLKVYKDDDFEPPLICFFEHIGKDNVKVKREKAEAEASE